MNAAQRPGRRTVAIAQVLLVLAAAALWAASRLTWVVIRSFDGLGPPKDVKLSGGSWSTALLPLAVLLVAAAIAALAVRGWPLRALAALLAAVSLAIGYLGVSLWVLPDVAARGAELAHVPLVTLVGSSRHYSGAVVAVVAATCTLIAAVLLLRSASASASSGGDTTKYVTRAARRSKAREAETDTGEENGSHMSERMIWDALDEGQDPTDAPRESDTEGR
ncbi:TIGR02234 family membrane protein [Mycobacterium sp. 1423905.2]|uniref:TIGR02234 family membrane protein n=1 Tax=Mycobacterium sp. 1423905.2 TaxID=1856859 RepID=UPI000801A9F5|nr:TIGR02234 family membrane protein [Mycobacterium sp. 1423905.2]OBJ61948.1 hypothetical protein A9W95_08675 [Mycobacterium sp. 1423905.2]